MRESLREQDICGRFGGEEFLIILPETTLRGAKKLADRIRRLIEKRTILFQEQEIKTTVSAGVSQFYAARSDGKTLFKMADEALKKAKESGKNKVKMANGFVD